MEIKLFDGQLADGQMEFESLPFGDDVLKIKINVSDYEVQDNPLHEDYRKKVIAASDDYFKWSFCIHFKEPLTKPLTLEDANKCLLRVHGFLWDKNNSVPVQGVQVRIHHSLHLNDNIYDFKADIPIAQSAASSGNVDPRYESCIGNEWVSEAIVDVLIRDKKNFYPDYSTVSISLVSGNEVPPPPLMASTSDNNQLAILDSDEIEMMRITRKIRDFKIFTDVIIVSNDGTQFSSNKVFLAAHSSVLKAMIEEDMKTENTGKIEMPEMTSNGVKAFLEFIFTCDLDPARENFEIAFELLQAACKYEIKTLEKKVLSILVMEVERFNVDMAFDLFIFTRKINSMKDIKMKLALILWTNRKEFMMCRAYKKKLAEDSAEAADAVQELFCLQP